MVLVLVLVLVQVQEKEKEKKGCCHNWHGTWIVLGIG
jgi:hypothetical protein